MNQLISILLATSIVACPLLCKGGAACCAKERSNGAPACCDACHKTNSDRSADRESVPSDPNSRTPRECGGCICGGAVVQDSALQQLVLDGCNWIALPAVHQSIAVAVVMPPAAVSWALLPDDGMNPGRAMRCLIMSYLC